jgi:hypothetical protein
MSQPITPDDTVTCGLCGHQTSIAMIQQHLVDKHDYDLHELADAIADAPILDATDPRETGA